MTTTKPHELHKKKLVKRAQQQIALTSGVTPKALQKTPSQKHSESLRKKLTRGASPEPNYDDDCRGCPDKPLCGKLLEKCGQEWKIARCKTCGKKHRYRWIEGEVWMNCTRCREGKK